MFLKYIVILEMGSNEIVCVCVWLWSYKWEAIDQDSNVRYALKICDSSPDTECGKGSAVCAHNLTSSQYQSVGKCNASMCQDHTTHTAKLQQQCS